MSAMENLRRTVAGVQSLLVQDDDFRQLARSNVRVVQLIYTVDRLEATVQAAIDEVVRKRTQEIQATTADRVARTFEQLRAKDQERYVDLLKRYNNMCAEGYEPAFPNEELERRQAHAIKILNQQVKNQASMIQARDAALAEQASMMCALELRFQQWWFWGFERDWCYPPSPPSSAAGSTPVFPPGLPFVSAAPGYYQAYAPVAGTTRFSASSGIPSASIPPHYAQAAGPPRCTCASVPAPAVNTPLSAPRCPYASGSGYTSFSRSGVAPVSSSGYTSSSAPRTASSFPPSGVAPVSSPGFSAPRTGPFPAPDYTPVLSSGVAPSAPRPTPTCPPSGIPNPPWPAPERPFSPTIRRPAAPAPPAVDKKIPTTPERNPAIDTPSSPSGFSSDAETLAAGYVRLDSGAEDNDADAEDNSDDEDDLPVLIPDSASSTTSSSSSSSLATDRSIDDEDDEAWTSVPADEADAAQEAAF